MNIAFDPAQQLAANSRMSEIEKAWKQSTGLTDRSDYSIFYGPLVQSPILVLSANPGGSPDNFKIVDVTRGEHEYIEGYGPTSQNTGRLLQQALGVTSAEGIRGIPGSNVIWRRSPTLAELKLSPLQAAREAAPHLREIIAYVKPRIIIFGGSNAFDLFARTHDIEIIEQGETILGRNGAREALYFGHWRARLACLGTELDVFVVLHPCKGLRSEAVSRLRRHLQRILPN